MSVSPRFIDMAHNTYHTLRDILEKDMLDSWTCYGSGSRASWDIRSSRASLVLLEEMTVAEGPYSYKIYFADWPAWKLRKLADVLEGTLWGFYADANYVREHIRRLREGANRRHPLMQLAEVLDE